MKQNKNSSVIRFLSFLTALVVLVFSIFVPSFAYTDTSTNGIDFTDQPIPSVTVSGSPDYSSIVSDSFKYASNDNFDFYVSVRNASGYLYSNVFVFAIPHNSSYDYYVCGPNPDDLSSITVYFTNINKSTSVVRGSNTSSIGGDNDYRYGVFNYSVPGTPLVPVFDTSSAGISAVQDWLANPPAPVPDPQGPLNISIPCGNALFIDISDLTGLSGSLSTQTSQSHSSPFSWNSTLSYTDIVPTSGSPVGNSINWVGTGGTDVFGRYRSWSCNLIVQPNKKYIAITNPFFNSEYLDPEHEDTNFPIIVSLSNYRDYFFVPLNAQYVNGEGVQNSYTDEQTQAPTPGGNNTTTTGNSINDFLQNIASSISGFFQGAIGAVSTLVSAGSDFMRSVSGLYTWLPAPVYTVLTSAIILVITIGVIKVFI